MKQNWRTIIVLGLFFGLLFGRSAAKTHPMNYDGKLFYVGARLLVTGGNPYDYGELQAGSRRWAPEGKYAGDAAQAQVHLPATLICFLPFCWLPWGVFCWFLGLLNGFAVPMIAYLCLRYVQEEPDTKSLCVCSLLVAIFPATWQNNALGQVGLLATLFALLAVRALEQKKYLLGGVFCLLALLKITCCLPLLLVVFARSGARVRTVLANAMSLWCILIVAGAFYIGFSRFKQAYRAGMNDMFRPGGPNFPTAGFRVDMSALLAAIFHPPLLTVIQTAVTLVLVGIYLAVWRIRKTLNLEDVAALSLLALLLFYHQAYDATLLLPVMLLGYVLLRVNRRQSVDWGLVGLIVLCLMSLGNHNVLDLLLKPLHKEQPYYFRPILFIGTYLMLILKMWRQRNLALSGPSGLVSTG